MDSCQNGWSSVVGIDILRCRWKPTDVHPLIPSILWRSKRSECRSWWLMVWRPFVMAHAHTLPKNWNSSTHMGDPILESKLLSQIKPNEPWGAFQVSRGNMRNVAGHVVGEQPPIPNYYHKSSPPHQCLANFSSCMSSGSDWILDIIHWVVVASFNWICLVFSPIRGKSYFDNHVFKWMKTTRYLGHAPLWKVTLDTQQPPCVSWLDVMVGREASDIPWVRDVCWFLQSEFWSKTSMDVIYL